MKCNCCGVSLVQIKTVDAKAKNKNRRVCECGKKLAVGKYKSGKASVKHKFFREKDAYR
jgi:hypothetical protein